MGFFSDIKDIFSNPSRKRKYIFFGIGAFVLLLIIIIIICCTTGGKSKETKNSNLTPFESYLNTKKYLYVWTYPNANNFIQFLVDHKFSKIFLYVGCLEWNKNDFLNGNFYNAGDIDSKELIKKLNNKNIEVELCIYVNDDFDDFTNVEKMPEIAKAISKLKDSLKFTALHFDVEPNSKENYEALLKMYEECRKYIKVSAILKPAWLTQEMSSLENYFDSSDYFKKFKDCETFAEAVVKVTDYSDVMAYSNQYSKINNFLDIYEKILKKYSSHIGKPVLELETVIETYSTYERYLEDKDNFFNYFANVSKKFDGVTIHHYTVWYKDLYCDKVTKDSNYYFGEPKTC